ncbi:CPBP family intramembrane glutamic endopeptidase [Robertmurraya sp. Marseille-Q9965]
MESVKLKRFESKILLRIPIELFLMFSIMILTALFFPPLKGVVTCIAIVYFFIEHKIRNRTKAEMGLTFKGLSSALKKIWAYVFLVSIIMQFFFSVIYIYFFPSVYQHVIERVPLELTSTNFQLLFTIVILAFGEEIVFRGFIQSRLNTVMPTPIAILTTSVLFALVHYKPAAASDVAVDLSTVFIDSVLYGIIFARTRNVYIATIAHALANIMAIISLQMF